MNNRLALSIALVVSAYASAAAIAAPVTIIPQADTWEFNFGSSLGAGPIGTDFALFTAGFTGGNIGQAGFSNTVAPSGGVVNTAWAAGSAAYLQQSVDLATGVTDVVLNLAVDNGASVWVNGSNVFNQDAGGFTSIWEYSQSVPSSVFVVGSNTVSVIANDYGGATYFDLELVAEMAPIDPDPIPAPATLALMGLGLAGLGWRRR